MAKEDDETIYDEEGREEMVDESEISPEEEGFMKGYDDADGDKTEHKEESEEKVSKGKKKKLKDPDEDSDDDKDLEEE